jgi:hypothetical protein
MTAERLIEDPIKPIMAVDTYRTNGALIAACAQLGYLRPEWTTLDPTYGRGTFWTVWKPNTLVAHDLNPALSPTGQSVDATNLPYPDRFFDCVVIDGPYKLNGTPSAGDERYGVHEVTPWRERLELLGQMLAEAARVLGDGYLLMKCQNQICSGKMRWQTILFTEQAAALGIGLVASLDMISYRPQPPGTRQVHPRQNTSTLLILKRGYTWR